MIEINGQPAEIEMTLEITRAATGKKETVELIGTINNIEQDKENGSDTHSSS
jgi:hypothetical protein